MGCRFLVGNRADADRIIAPEVRYKVPSGDRLAHGVEDARRFVADVAGVDAAVARDDLAQFGDAVRGSQRTGRHGKHARQAEGSVFHRVLDKGFHLVELCGRGSLERIAHDALPDVVETDVRRDVGGNAGVFQGIEVAAEGCPVDGLAADGRPARRELAEVRAGGAAFAENFGGDALTDLALGVAVLQEQEVGVRVHVDEAGGHDEPLGVDLALGRSRRHTADRHDVAIAHGQVAAEPGVAAAVDDAAVANDEIVGRFRRRGRALGEQDEAGGTETEIEGTHADLRSDG